MSLPEAIVYLLASADYGMKTDQIAREINERRLYVRRDGRLVSDKQVLDRVISHSLTFTLDVMGLTVINMMVTMPPSLNKTLLVKNGGLLFCIRQNPFVLI